MINYNKYRLRIGTRASPLALIQASLVKDQIIKSFPNFSGRIDLVPIVTSGDNFKEIQLSKIGGKGLFTKEIDQALFDGSIHAAVHSMKDVESILPEGTIIGGTLPRADPRDVLISKDNVNIAELPLKALVGTSSPRRKAQLLSQRKDLQIVTIRGNVQTRLKKFLEGDVDAVLLALAGLQRLEVKVNGKIIEAEEMLPAAGQGIIGVQLLEKSYDFIEIFSSINDLESYQCLTAERALLKEIDGSCRTPIGVNAYKQNKQIILNAKLYSLDGVQIFAVSKKGPSTKAELIGREAGMELNEIIPSELRETWL